MWQEQNKPLSVSSSGQVMPGETMEESGSGLDEYYVAKFRNLTFDRASLHQNLCFVPVSLGQEYHEGRKFDAIMRLVEKTFRECVIIVSDTLHRHTLAIGDSTLSKLKAYELSVEVGREWVRANQAAWADMGIPCRIVYWSDLLCDSGYLPNRCALDDICRADSYADALVDEMVSYFVASACEEGVCTEERERVAALSREYLMEEHAIQLRMIPHAYPKHHFVYPHTNRLDPLMQFYEHIAGEMCRWLRLRLTRRQVSV